jgi:bifunctional non-homologous end joining protein LigD
MKPQQLLRRVFPPMLATLTTEPPGNESSWIYELKYDGFRAVVAITGGEMAMLSRNEIDLAPRFPRIAEAVSKIKAKEVVLDGEIVALDEKGAPRFQLLQQGNRELIFFFDILWLDGQDLRSKPYEERRAILEKVLRRPPAGVKIAEIIEKPWAEALRDAAKDGYEGIIAKRRGSTYETRRSKEWLKIKALNQQELVIIGFQPSTHSAREIGSLHLAVFGKDGELHYAGKVGTGFSYKLRVWLKDELTKDVVPQPMAKDAPRVRTATWVRPRLVAQVAFTEWTGDNRLRHPSFLGLREDKAPAEVVKEEPMTTGAGRKARGANESKARPAPSATRPPSLTLTHPERVLYPRDKITKEDVAAYYDAMAKPMMRALAGRPLSLEHWNQGIDHPSWFHQHLGKEAPSWLTTIETPTRVASRKTVSHLVVDSPEALRWLAQMSVLTIHMWNSHEPKLEEPDWIVFDLDPAKDKGIEQAIEAAIIVRKLLDNLKLPSVPKTSGKRGIHVFVPLAKGYSHEDANAFACHIAGAIAASVPAFTVERALNQRRGRLYLDCMQNAYGKTIVAPYALRAIDGAPVSAPLKWSEVTKKLDPKKYNLRTMPERLAKVGDLFEAVFKDRAKLPKFT